jgi:phage terminase large subunit-like protein
MWITNKTTGYKTPRLWIENTAPVEYTKKELPIDPYTLGLVLGDGYFHINDYSVKLTGAKKDMEYYYTQIPYEIGYKDTSREESSIVATIKGIAKDYRFLGLHETKAQNKFIPDMYKRGSIEQRLALLQGLIDTDGTIANGKRGTRFMTTSPKLAEDVMNLVRSLGGTASSSISNKAGEIVTIQGKTATRNYDLIRVYIHLNMPTARLPRKVKKLDNNTDAGRVAIIDIEKIETEESQCIKVDNESHQFLTSNYTRTHNSGGIRSGSRNPVTGDRYAIIIADDVIKNEAEAYSEVIMHNVTTALNSDALNAMRAKNTQLVLINTPFHKRDPIYMLVESGGFTPLVTPICEEIREDLTEEEFRGLWPDMHDYVSVMERFRNAMATNSTKAFYQELMLRVANEEDRLITDDMLNGQWFDRTLIMKMIEGYNIYITTDFTTTSAAKSDFSALAVWAISSNNDYFLMDLCLRRQELQQQYDELFRMVSTWSKGGKPVEVGIEIDGQQKAHLFAIKEMMQKKNIYFSFARQKGAPVTREGILSKAGGANKFERFRFVLPMLQNRKVFFPEQLKENPEMREAIKQLKGTTHSGFSTHDDFCDVVSQLGLIDILPGSEANPEEELTDVSKFFWGSLEDDDKYEGSKSTIF